MLVNLLPTLRIAVLYSTDHLREQRYWWQSLFLSEALPEFQRLGRSTRLSVGQQRMLRKQWASPGRRKPHFFVFLILQFVLILLANDHGKNQVGRGWRLATVGSLPSPPLGRIAVLGTFGVFQQNGPKKPPPNNIDGILWIQDGEFLFSFALLKICLYCTENGENNHSILNFIFNYRSEYFTSNEYLVKAQQENQDNSLSMKNRVTSAFNRVLEESDHDCIKSNLVSTFPNSYLARALRPGQLQECQWILSGKEKPGCAWAAKGELQLLGNF